MTYSMKCTCGDVIRVEAATREEAVAKIKGMMPPEMVANHMSEKHNGQPAPSQEQVYMMIEANTQEGDLQQAT